MDWLLATEAGRFLLLVLAGIGFFLQFDNLLDAEKGGRQRLRREAIAPCWDIDWRV